MSCLVALSPIYFIMQYSAFRMMTIFYIYLSVFISNFKYIYYNNKIIEIYFFKLRKILTLNLFIIFLKLYLVEKKKKN